jgi:pilus assembly protein CpaE
MNEKIRVLVIDTSDIQTYQTLADDFYLIDIVNDDNTGMKMIADHHPDVVLIGSGIIPDAIDLARQIKQSFPAIKILMSSYANDPRWLRNALLAGADNFLSKPLLKDELYKTIHHVSDKRIDQGKK